jgi:pantetheine-phosphate adenylyltransferase
MADRKAVYPGSFDPITNGHLDIVERSRRLFGEVVVAVLENPEKVQVFSHQDRLETARQAVAGMKGVTVDSFHGLLVDYLEKHQARVIIRGIRAVSDFEYEFQMAMMNRRLKAGIETVFLMPSEMYFYLSSRLVHEVAALGGDVTGLVPPVVLDMLADRYPASRKRGRT